MTPRRLHFESISPAFVLRVRDGDVVREIPVPAEFQPGKGPGPLQWELVDDAGHLALCAAWCRGRFEILSFGTANQCGLFYQHDGAGSFELLARGTVAALKREAETRTVLRPQPVAYPSRPKPKSYLRVLCKPR